MRVWRLVKTRHAATAFDGAGARRFGGRWNNPGVRVAYAAGSVSLAVLEVLVHLDAAALLPAYSLCPVEFEEALIERLDPTGLPRAWRDYPAPSELSALGDAWVASGRAAVLQVPSAIVPDESNYLLNPVHPDFGKVRIRPPEPFRWDPRLASGVKSPTR
ncbi:MAG: RES family NAD+ phosphorylase [Gemmatimonadota bacterium]